MSSSLPLCSDPTVSSQLRAWVDPLPMHTDAALPPGVVPPAAPPRGPETHALNIELSLHNSSRRSQAARVLSASWSQGSHSHSLPWNVQPDLSPLNRFSHIQRQLVLLTDHQPLRVDLSLELNGRRCRLEAHIPAADIPAQRG